MNRIVLASLATLISANSFATPVTYVLDPRHTYPSFAADHMGGLSVWRGKFTDTSGKVVYDKDAKTGSIEVTVNMNSVDFGLAKLDEHAKSPDLLDVAKISDRDLLGNLHAVERRHPDRSAGQLDAARRDQAADAQDQFVHVQTEPDDQEGGLRCRCLGDLQPQRLRDDLRRRLRLQDVGEARDPGRGQSRRARPATTDDQRYPICRSEKEIR